MITYREGSLLDQKGILCHCVNNQGRMGAGVALVLSKKWPVVKSYYHEWAEANSSSEILQTAIGFTIDTNITNEFELGNIQLVQVEQDVYVCNLIGQVLNVRYDLDPPIRYEALEKGFQRLKYHAKKLQLPIHIPRIGCSLAGGSWKVVSKIIDEVGLNVTVWDIDKNWNE